MPDGAREGILKGLYLFRAAQTPGAKARVQLFGSGAIFNEALAAAEILRDYDVEADVWSVTSYKELRREALEVERWNRFHPADKPREAWITRCLKDQPGPVIAASDYLSALPDLVARFVPGGLVSLGTDGFGRSEGRAALRDFFEVDRRWIALAALSELHRQKKVRITAVHKLVKDLELDLSRPAPSTR